MRPALIYCALTPPVANRYGHWPEGTMNDGHDALVDGAEDAVLVDVDVHGITGAAADALREHPLVDRADDAVAVQGGNSQPSFAPSSATSLSVSIALGLLL